MKELLANEAIYILQQIGDVSVRQTVDMIGKTLEINVSSTCVKPCNGTCRMMSY